MTGTALQPEEETITCQFCKKLTPLEYNFCVECDNQIKCLECGKKTFPGKEYCLACAKPLFVRPATNQAPNQYERSVEQDGDKYKEHTRFALSDNAVHEIAPFVVSQTMPGIKARPNAPVPPTSLSNGQPIDTFYEDLSRNEYKEKDAEHDTDAATNKSSEAQVNTNQYSENSSLSRYFQHDGDSLVAVENDFKGQNWTEQQRRFILLYAKAYKDIFNKPVPNKEEIKSAAERLKIVDQNNFTNHLSRAITAHMTQMSNGLVLNTAGDKEVTKILKQMEEESPKSGYAYWSRPASAPAQQSYLSKDDKARVMTWIDASVDLGQLEIRDVKTARDYALLAFWIIIHHIQKANALKWNEAMLYLTTKYDTTSVKGGAFSKAMTGKGSEKYFTKSGEGAYYLTTDGQKLVENWVSGAVSIKKQTS